MKYENNNGYIYYGLLWTLIIIILKETLIINQNWIIEFRFAVYFELCWLSNI